MRNVFGTRAVVFAFTIFSIAATAAEKEPYSAVRDGAGKVVKDGRGDCVQALSTKRTIAEDCGARAAVAPPPPPKPAMVAEPVAVQPAPTPAPADMTPDVAVPPAVVKEEISIEGGALFEFDRAEIRPQAKSRLAALAGKLKSQSDVDEIVISGHADATGPEGYNQDLSKRRAESVRKFLLKEGVVSKRIVVEAHGEEKPVASNDTKAGRAQNRRVEITVTAK